MVTNNKTLHIHCNNNDITYQWLPIIKHYISMVTNNKTLHIHGNNNDITYQWLPIIKHYISMVTIMTTYPW